MVSRAPISANVQSQTLAEQQAPRRGAQPRVPQGMSSPVQVCGFSGTNDNRQLLPFSVKPEFPEDTATQGTDGKMVDVLATPGKCRFLRLADAAEAAPHRLRLGPSNGAATNGHVSGGGGEMERALLQDAAREGSAALQNGASDGGAVARAASAGAYHGKRLLDLVVLLGVHALIDAGALRPL